jgi:hypothetical protein
MISHPPKVVEPAGQVQTTAVKPDVKRNVLTLVRAEEAQPSVQSQRRQLDSLCKSHGSRIESEKTWTIVGLEMKSRVSVAERIESSSRV